MRWFYLAGVAVLTGCGVSPLAQGTAPAPAYLKIQARVDVPESSDWLGAQASRLDVESLVRGVLERNPSLRAMEKAWRASAARIEQAGAWEDPMLSYSVAPLSLADHEMRDGHEVELSQKLPWPGRLRLRREAARRESYAAAQDLRDAHQVLARDARRMYYEYAYLLRAIEINKTNGALMEQSQRTAENKYAAGTGSKQDALQAQLERLHLKYEGLSLERSFRTTVASINALLHRPSDARLPPPAPLPAARAAPDLAHVREAAVNGRADLQALAQRYEAAKANRRLARTEYLPEVTVMASYNSMWNDPEHRFMVGAGVNLPVHLARRRAREIEALSESQRLASELAAGVDRVGQEVAEACESIRESVEVLKLYDAEFLTAARQGLQAARAGYEAGNVGFLTLLMAERDLRVSELARERALVDHHRAWAELQRVVGGNLPEENTR